MELDSIIKKKKKKKKKKIPLCQFTLFVTITYTKLTWQIYPASKKFGNFRGKYRNTFYLKNQVIYNLSNPNSLCLGKIYTNSLCFGKISKFPVVFPDREFFWVIFPVFPVQWVPCVVQDKDLQYPERD